jgi:gliding motility-associated lipoprotein GldH
MKNLTNKIILGLFAVLALASCNKNTVYDDFKELPAKGWSKDSSAVFTVPVKDINSSYRVLINVRNRGDYKTQNLWLFLSFQRPDKTIKQDTVECYLADNSGKWLGSGFGSLYEMPVLYLKDMKFSQAGNYTFTIKQGMRDSVLVGINDIGLEVQKVQK